MIHTFTEMEPGDEVVVGPDYAALHIRLTLGHDGSWTIDTEINEALSSDDKANEV